MSITPTPTITNALAVGSTDGEPAGHRQARGVHHRDAQPGEGGRQPEAEGDDHHEPERELVLGHGGEQDDERRRAGDQPGRRAHREDAARGEVLRVVMVMVVPVRVRLPLPRPRAQHRGADHHHEQARGQVQPRVQLLWQHERRQRERDDAEQQHTGRMRDRDGRAQRGRVLRGPARADEVRGDHGLAVAGGERVHRAPPERGEQQQDQHALAGGGVLEEAGEAGLPAAVTPTTGVLRVRSGGLDGAGSGPHVEPRGADVGGGGLSVARVAGEAARRVRGGHAGAHRGALAGPHDDRAPPDPAGERAVAHHDLLPPAPAR